LNPQRLLKGVYCDQYREAFFHILSHHDAPNIRPARLEHVFHILCVVASGNLRGVLGGKAAIANQP
jgi:hypothetical protein